MLQNLHANGQPRLVLRLTTGFLSSPHQGMTKSYLIGEKSSQGIISLRPVGDSRSESNGWMKGYSTMFPFRYCEGTVPDNKSGKALSPSPTTTISQRDDISFA